jgi:hypothetical protein
MTRITKILSVLASVGALFVPQFSDAQNSPAALQRAVFAGGCFWCIQPAFDKAPGVTKTTVGYCGGTEPNPTYELVGSEKTNYRESIEIVYDPAKISYEQLLDIYWKQIDHRHRPELSRRDFLWKRRREKNRGSFKGKAGAFREIQETDRNRNFADDEILSRRGLSSKILPAKSGTFRGV